MISSPKRQRNQSNKFSIQIGAIVFSSICTLLLAYFQKMIIDQSICFLMSSFVFVCDAGAFFLFSYSIQFKRAILQFYFLKIILALQNYYSQNEVQYVIAILSPIIIFYLYRLILKIVFAIFDSHIFGKNNQNATIIKNQQQSFSLKDVTLETVIQQQKDKTINIQLQVNEYLRKMNRVKIEIKFFIGFNCLVLVQVLFNIIFLQINLDQIISYLQKQFVATKFPFSLQQIEVCYKVLFQVNTALVLIFFSIWVTISQYIIQKYNSLWNLLLKNFNTILFILIFSFLLIVYCLQYTMNVEFQFQNQLKKQISLQSFVSFHTQILFCLQSIFVTLLFVILLARLYLGAVALFNYNYKHKFHKGQGINLDKLFLQKIIVNLEFEQQSQKRSLKKILNKSSENVLYGRMSQKINNNSPFEVDIYILSIYDKFSRYCCILLFYVSLAMYILNQTYHLLAQLLLSLYFIYNYKNQVNSVFTNAIILFIYKKIQKFTISQQLFMILRHLHFYIMILLIWVNKVSLLIFKMFFIQQKVVSQTQLNKEWTYGLIKNTKRYIQKQIVQLHYQINSCAQFKNNCLMLQSILMAILLIFIICHKSKDTSDNNTSHNQKQMFKTQTKTKSKAYRLKDITILAVKIITPFIILYEVLNLQCISISQTWFILILIIGVSFLSVNAQISQLKGNIQGIQ